MQFPTVSQRIVIGHSILDGASLGELAARHWRIDAPRCTELLQHGQNDWYRLETTNRCYAIRVLKSGLRTPQQLLEEILWTQALHQDGIACACALSTNDGLAGVTLDAPEGPRMVCLHAWIEGRTLNSSLSSADAREAGQLLARIHLSSAQLPLDARRHRLAEKLNRTAPALDRALIDDRQKQMVAATRLAIATALAEEQQLPQGSLHGDMHFGNLRRAVSGQLYPMDFDDCGRGALCVDLTPFLWRNRSENIDPTVAASFLEGYAALRRITAAEREALPALLAARALYLAGVLARDRNVLGSVPGFDKPWQHYLDLAEACLRTERPAETRG